MNNSELNDKTRAIIKAIADRSKLISAPGEDDIKKISMELELINMSLMGVVMCLTEIAMRLPGVKEGGE